MRGKPYYTGNLKKDSKESTHHGWIVGSFMENLPQKTKHVEIKSWEFPAGKGSHPTKISKTLEISIIIKGTIRGMVNNQTVTLSAGDYIVISPNTPNNITQNILKRVWGITIKAPSDINAKKIIG